jgi:hypothetical protein
LIAGLVHGDFEIHFPRAFTRRLKLLRLLPYRLYFAAVRRATPPGGRLASERHERPIAWYPDLERASRDLACNVVPGVHIRR